MDSIKISNTVDMTPEDEPFRSNGVQSSTGEKQRTIIGSSRKCEADRPKLTGHLAVDVSGVGRKV